MKQPETARKQKPSFPEPKLTAPRDIYSSTENEAVRDSLKSVVADWLPPEAPRDSAELFRIAHEYVREHPGGWFNDQQRGVAAHLFKAVGQINPENPVTNSRALTVHMWRAAEMVVKRLDGTQTEPDLIRVVELLACTACVLDGRLFDEAWSAASEREVRP